MTICHLKDWIKFCSKNKINIIDIETKESDLEDIFKKLINTNQSILL